MKQYIIYIACLLAILWGCNSKQKTDDHTGHNHTEESNAGHDHSKDGHTHADGEECSHNHEHEAEHNHAPGETCDHDHSTENVSAEHGDEIMFTPEQAKSAGLETVTVQPSTFYQKPAVRYYLLRVMR